MTFIGDLSGVIIPIKCYNATVALVLQRTFIRLYIHFNRWQPVRVRFKSGRRFYLFRKLHRSVRLSEKLCHIGYVRYYNHLLALSGFSWFVRISFMHIEGNVRGDEIREMCEMSGVVGARVL